MPTALLGTPVKLDIGNSAILTIDASGNVTLAPYPGGTLNVAGAAVGARIPVQTIAGDGAITIPVDGASCVLLTKGSAAAITLAAPSVAQNGTVIYVQSLTGFAHVITSPVDGFNAKGSSGTATAATTFIGLLMLVADGGHWYTMSRNLWTIA